MSPADGESRRSNAAREAALHVHSGGRGKPSLVLVHGFGAYGFFWRKWSPILEARHRVHNVDLTGFGRAPTPIGGDYSPVAQARRLASFVRQIAEEGPTVLIGHSLGAGIVLLAALDLSRKDRRFPVAGIVIVSGAVYSQRLPLYLSLIRRRMFGELFLVCRPPRWALRLGIRGIVADPQKVDDEQIEGYRSPLLGMGRRKAILRAARQIDVGEAHRLTSEMRELRLPTLLLWGEDDRVVPLHNARRLARDLPQADLVTLPGVGHLPPEEAPRRSVAPVLDFLGSL